MARRPWQRPGHAGAIGCGAVGRRHREEEEWCGAPFCSKGRHGAHRERPTVVADLAAVEAAWRGRTGRRRAWLPAWECLGKITYDRDEWDWKKTKRAGKIETQRAPVGEKNGDNVLIDGHSCGARWGGSLWRERQAQAASDTIGMHHLAMQPTRGAAGEQRGCRWAGPLLQCTFLLFKYFSNWFALIQSKGYLPLHKLFQIKHGRVYNWIANRFPYWNFSKFGMEFELKIRELIWAKFEWIWILGTWELQNLLEFDM
jgi:hypothetical protein